MNHFLMGCQMKLCPLGDKMGVLEAIGWDVPKFTKDVPRVPNCFPMWKWVPSHFLTSLLMNHIGA